MDMSSQTSIGELINTGCPHFTKAKRGVSAIQRRDFVPYIQRRILISTKKGVSPQYRGATLSPIYKGTSHFSEGILRIGISDNLRGRQNMAKKYPLTLSILIFNSAR